MCITMSILWWEERLILFLIIKSKIWKLDETIDIIENVRRESEILSDLEYLLKLCLLEIKFKQCHTKLKVILNLTY